MIRTGAALPPDFDWKDRYTFWTGLIGGTFLALSYFGTDQSQVQRYLGGKSITQSRIGLLANGVVKIPMQFFILFLGAMVFVFYQFATPPLFFNTVETANIKKSVYASDYEKLEDQYSRVHNDKGAQLRELVHMPDPSDKTKTNNYAAEIKESVKKEAEIRGEAIKVIQKNNPKVDTNDTNYIFLTFVINILPAGLIGLILAAIFSASMSSTSAELSALASTTIVDLYKRIYKPVASDRHYLIVSKLFTVFCGLYAIAFGLFANRLGSLIEAVNILGSLFYGTVLGIFLIAFYLKKVGGAATFYSAIAAELIVMACYFFTEIPYLWYYVIGCLLTVILAYLFTLLFNRPNRYGVKGLGVGG